MKKLILIDANALVHRAFHALPPLTSPNGQLVNAVYGFTSVLLKTIKDLQPDYLAAAFDLAGPTFRHEEFEEYKAHREKAPDELYAQIPLIKEALRVFGVEIFEQAGFEADDFIGSVAERSKKIKDLQTIILTGDLDTLQLVEGDKVVVFTLRKGMTDTVLYDEKGVKDRYGLEPYQVVDFKGLKGDPSDNIPGVPGIGEKTAIALLQKYETVENLYKELEKTQDFSARGGSASGRRKGDVLTEKLAEKLKTNKDLAVFSKRLATIVRDVPIDFSLEKIDWKNRYKAEAVTNLIKSFGFQSLLARLPGKKEESLTQTGLGLGGPIVGPKKEGLVKEIKNAKDLSDFLKQSEKASLVYVFWADDTLYFVLEAKLSSIFSVSRRFIKEIKPLLENAKIKKIGHDTKPLARRLLKDGIHLAPITFDTALAEYLIKPELREYDLEKVYFVETTKSVNGPAESVLALPKLSELLRDKLKAKDLTKVFEDIEMPLIPVLAEMEKNGILVDGEILGSLSEKVNSEVGSLEKKIYKLAGMEFNINSPQQLGEVLFDKLLLKTKVRKTSGGARSTAASELDKLRDEHPIIEMIMQYRELQKLKTTYIDPFPGLIDATDKRLHTTYNQFGTVTGRLSSQDPNLQNIPIRTELGQEFRRAFVAEKSCELVSLDYSQLELRIAAHLSQDQKMIAAFKNGEDIHTRTAAEVFDVPLEKVTTNMRREAKALNFGILYGMGVSGFARSAGVDRMRAREFITKYFNEFSGVAAYAERVKKEARETGYVKTYFGRRRELPEINSGLPQLAAQAERMAINAPIQGTGADIMKLAMVRIYNFIHDNELENEAKILLQVHDELLCEIKEDSVNKLGLEFGKIMEQVWQVETPIVVDLKYGANWAEMENM